MTDYTFPRTPQYSKMIPWKKTTLNLLDCNLSSFGQFQICCSCKILNEF